MTLRRRTPLRPGKPLRRGQPLRQRSARRRAADTIRRQVREQVIRRDGRCQASLAAVDLLAVAGLDHRLAEWLEGLAADCLVWWADDVHEPLPRSRGGDPLDPDQCVLVCRRCHDDLHDHPAFARELGMTLRRTP